MQKTDIIEIHDHNLYEITLKLINSAYLSELIDRKNGNIVIKPDIKYINDKLFYTSPVILATIIKYLQDNNFSNISIVIGSLINKNINEIITLCNYQKIIEKMNITIYGINEDDYIKKSVGGIEFTLIKQVLTADFFINLVTSAKTKNTLINNALQSLSGCLHHSNDNLIRNLNYCKPISFLNYLIKQHFILVETDIMADIQAEKKLYCCLDAVLADAYYAKYLNYEIHDIEYIELSNKLSIGSMQLNKANILNLNGDIDFSTNQTNKLSSYVEEVNACPKCYANLLEALYKLDTENLLNKLSQTIYIGQGWRDFSENGIGIGRCCNKFAKNIMGCPPSTDKTYTYLKNLIEK